MGRYFINLLIGVDQFFNTLFGGAPDETISSRWGRNRKKSTVADIGCKVLNTIDEGHCEDAIELDEEGKPKAKHLEE